MRSTSIRSGASTTSTHRAGPTTITLSCKNNPDNEVVWTIEEPSQCEAPPSQCFEYAQSGACDADVNCRWLVPGCDEGMAPSVEVAGCYPAADCESVDCASWGKCETVTHNPCWNAPCDACGAETEVCAATNQ